MALLWSGQRGVVLVKEQGPTVSGIVLLMVLVLISGPQVLTVHSVKIEGPTGPFFMDMRGERGLSQLYWPMVGRDIFHTGAGAPAPKGLTDPALQWSDQSNSTAIGSVAADLRSNILFSETQERSVIAVFDSNLTTLVARDGDSGRTMWSLDVRTLYGRLTNTLLVAPALMDTNNDGKVEVLASINNGNDYQLALFEPSVVLGPSGYSWSPDAQVTDLLWISPNGTAGTLRYSSPCIHDLNSDNVEDVVLGTGNRLSAHNGANGSLLWSQDIGPVGEVLSTPAIYPGTGPTNRIVVNSLSSSRQTLRTTVINFQGAHLKNVTAALGSPIPHTFTGPVPTPIIGDLTGDGTREIIVSYPSLPGAGRLVCYTFTLDQFSVIGPMPGSLESYPAISDIDNDGNIEVLIHTRVFTTPPSLRMAAYRVFQNGTSRTLWVKDAPGAGTNPLHSPPLICDLDKDGLRDTVFVGNGRLHAIRGNGAYLWNLTLQTLPFTVTGVIGDIGNDQFTDLYIKGYKVTQALIDLQLDGSIQPNIYTDDPEPTEGRTMNLNCLVKNTGPSSARNVLVRFLDRAGSGPETIAGEDVLEDVVSTAEATVRWTPSSPGAHTITVQIDPTNTVLETDESNNNGSTIIMVEQAYPDLFISGIHFLRGDGKIAGNVHLIEKDPSWVLVSVGNKGDKRVDTFTLEVLIEGEAPPGGSRFTTAGPAPPGSITNVTVQWTPTSIPEGQAKRTFTIEATIDPSPGSVQESDETNNYGMNQTTVKNDTPLGSYTLDGTVLDPQGVAEDGARVVATLNRTQENLMTISEQSGEFSFDLAFLEYRDADWTHIRASKDNAWGEISKKVYSEDGGGRITIRETDQPLMSLSLSPLDPTEAEVPPGAISRFKITAQNMGNLPGNVTLTRSLEGNTSVKTSDITLSPVTFFLQVGGTREVTLEINVPTKEPPGSNMTIGITAVMTGDQSTEAVLYYLLTVKKQESLLFEMRSPTDRTVDQNVQPSATFEIYLLNDGNVRVDYNVSADESLDPYASYERQVGYLDPTRSVLVEVVLTVTPSVSQIAGGLVLRTAGQGTLWTWSVSVRALLPDLVAVSPIGFEPPAPVIGDRVKLIATIRNTGEGAAPSFDYELRDGPDLIGTATVPGLDPGEEASVSDVIWEPKAVGEHELVLTIDPALEMNEVQRGNNKVSRTFSFLPDLSIMTADVSKTVLTGGEPFTVLVTVENEGNAPLSGGFRVNAKLGSKDGKEIGSEVSSLLLEPGKGTTGTVELKLNAPKETGEFNLFLVVGPETSSDGEGDPSDNSYEVTGLKVGPNGESPDRTVLFAAIGIGALVLLALVGGGIYLWKRDEGGESIDEVPEAAPTVPSSGVKVEPDIVGTGAPLPDGSVMEDEKDDGSYPVMTMDLEGEVAEGTIVAEVLDEAPPPTTGVEVRDGEEEVLIPEI